MSRLQQLLNEIRELEARVSEEVSREAEDLGYRIKQGRIYFETEVLQRHKEMATSVRRYLAESSWQAILSVPIIYSLAIPLLLLDLFVTFYQLTCFPLYGITKVKRRDYIALDRHMLKYLNPIERIHCIYCGYANGLIAYCLEIGARTEQYWCPIKHSRRVRGSHSRYYDFFPYGDAEAYQQELENLRRKLRDDDKRGGAE